MKRGNRMDNKGIAHVVETLVTDKTTVAAAIGDVVGDTQQESHNENPQKDLNEQTLK